MLMHSAARRFGLHLHHQHVGVARHSVSLDGDVSRMRVFLCDVTTGKLQLCYSVSGRCPRVSTGQQYACPNAQICGTIALASWLSSASVVTCNI